MKKLLLGFAALLVAISLTACGGSPDIPEEEPQEQEVHSPITKADLEDKCFIQTKTVNAEELQAYKAFINEISQEWDPPTNLGDKVTGLDIRYYYRFVKPTTENDIYYGYISTGFTYYYNDNNPPTNEEKSYILSILDSALMYSEFNFDWDVRDNEIIINNIRNNLYTESEQTQISEIEIHGYSSNSKIIIKYPKTSAASVYMGTGSTDIKHTLSRCSNVWIEDGDDDIFIQDDISDDDIAQYGQYLTKGADEDYIQNGYDIILTDKGAEKFVYLMLQLWEDYSGDELNGFIQTYGIPGYFLVYNKKVYDDLPINPANNNHGLTETTHYVKTHGGLVRELTDEGKAILEGPTM